MSKVTIETTITRAYLRNKTKDEIIEHVMRLLGENDALWAEATRLKSREAEIFAKLTNLAEPPAKACYNAIDFINPEYMVKGWQEIEDLS